MKEMYSPSFQRTALVISLLLMLPATGLYAQGRTSTPLHWAARHGHLEVVETLIANGADVNAVDVFGRTPLHLAAPHPVVMEMLIGAGADVDARDQLSNTPLHRAVPQVDAVDALIAAGADVTAENTSGNTPLDIAMRYGNSRRSVRVVQRLVEAGAGVQ